MRVIPVLDLSRGGAVHARAGDRSRYEPVRSVLAPGADGDPVALLRAFTDALGAAECYVADIDAIEGGTPQLALLRRLARLGAGTGCSLLVDAGIDDPARARELLAGGAGQLVVGLEALRAFDHLAAIARVAGPSRTIFSLDLRHGTPIVHPALRKTTGEGYDVSDLADRAVAAGVRTLLVLDLGLVGTGGGVDLRLLETLRRRFPSASLLAGGGVLTRDDLDRMRDAGCDGALVASAIHSGRIGAKDVTALAAPTGREAHRGTSDSR